MNAGRVSSKWLLSVSFTLLAACNGGISQEKGGVGPTPAGGAGNGGTAGTSGAAGTTPTGTPDVGSVAVHRLNNLEYDNTMRDLLGVDGMAQKTFQSDEKGTFDNDADMFTLNDARYEQYFTNADTIGETVFADTAPTGLRQTYVYGLVTPACTPSATDTACSSKIINAFAAKAWRRPLTTADAADLLKLATDAVALGETADGGLKQVVKVILASPQFLYRIEYDPNPGSPTPHMVDPYELATRLSYLMFSSMPDKTLFDLAASKQILDDTVLTQQVDRMLADPKAASFTASFAGQWLGARDMQSHQVEPLAFPSFDEPLRAAMVQEQLMYFDQFLTGTLPFTQFFTAPTNFVNTRLAKHYGLPAVAASAGFQKVTNADPNRVGFMGLGSFLTVTSYSYRTTPTKPRPLVAREPPLHAHLAARRGAAEPRHGGRARDGSERPAGERALAARDAPRERALLDVPRDARSNRPRPRELRRHRRLSHDVRRGGRAHDRCVGDAADGRDVLVAEPARRDPLLEQPSAERTAEPPPAAHRLREPQADDVRAVAGAHVQRRGLPVHDPHVVGLTGLGPQAAPQGHRPQRHLPQASRRDVSGSPSPSAIARDE